MEGSRSPVRWRSGSEQGGPTFAWTSGGAFVVSQPDPTAATSGSSAVDAQPGSSRSAVQSIDRAAAILRCFTEESTLGASQLARLTGLSVSTTHRLLTALQANGFVRQVDSKRFELGPLVLRLARSAHARLSIRDLALPTMRQLRDESLETVGLHTLQQDNTRAVIDQVESEQPLRRIYTELGESIPLNQGAPGKVMLAYLPESEFERVLSGPLRAATSTTPIDADVLRAEVAAIRAQGYAISLSERVSGIHTIAFPVKDHDGRVTASISITGPAERMSPERLRQIAALAKPQVDELSRTMGS